MSKVKKRKIISKASIKAVIYKPSSEDFFLEKIDAWTYKVHWTSKDAATSIKALMSKFEVEDAGRGYYGSSYIIRHRLFWRIAFGWALRVGLWKALAAKICYHLPPFFIFDPLSKKPVNQVVPWLKQGGGCFYIFCCCCFWNSKSVIIRIEWFHVKIYLSQLK